MIWHLLHLLRQPLRHIHHFSKLIADSAIVTALHITDQLVVGFAMLGCDAHLGQALVHELLSRRVFR
jgi:hypothetical protein